MSLHVSALTHSEYKELKLKRIMDNCIKGPFYSQRLSIWDKIKRFFKNLIKRISKWIIKN
jgi:hypothetical protein